MTYSLDDDIAGSGLAAKERISFRDGNLQALPQEADFVREVFNECIAFSLLGNEFLFFFFELLQDLSRCAKAAFCVSGNLLFKRRNRLNAEFIEQFVNALDESFDKGKAKFLKRCVFQNFVATD